MSTELTIPLIPSISPSQTKIKWMKMQIQQAIGLKLPAFKPSN